MSYWRCIKEIPNCDIFTKNHIYWLDENGYFYGNSYHKVYPVKPNQNGLEWVEENTNYRFEYIGEIKENLK